MRVARVVLVVLIVLGGLFVAADRVAVRIVEGKAADRAQVSEGLAHKPKVSIEGFPFLTQAASGTLDEVKVSADDIRAGGDGRSVRIDSFHADLRGVKLSDGFSHAVADTADGVAFITFADLTRAAPAGVTVSYAGESTGGKTLVKLSAKVQGVGSELSVLSELTVSADSTISLHAQPLPTAFTALGLDGRIRQHIDFRRTLTHLPRGIALTSVTAAPDGISVVLGGTHVVLAG
jgi:hypothetical protein